MFVPYNSYKFLFNMKFTNVYTVRHKLCGLIATSDWYYFLIATSDWYYFLMKLLHNVVLVN